MLFHRAPAFISGEKKVNISETVDGNDNQAQSASDEDQAEGDQEQDDQEQDMDEDSASEDSSASISRPASPRIRMDEDEEEVTEERPRFGGIGSKGRGSEKISTPSFSSGGLGFTSSSAGIGAGKAGIGSKAGTSSSFNRAGASTSVDDALPTGLPTAFGTSTARAQRSFVRSDTGSGSNTPARAATPLSASESAHFGKLSGTFGARMLSKMGWTAGVGLGTEGQGIVTPVESKLRPKGMGIAFKGFREKTEQSKAEARRRGEVVSEDEEEGKKRRGKGKGKGKVQEKREEVWKKPKKTKVKTEHKTYEEIIAEVGEPPAAGVGKIIDATGATVSSRHCILRLLANLKFS